MGLGTWVASLKVGIFMESIYPAAILYELPTYYSLFGGKRSSIVCNT